MRETFSDNFKRFFLIRFTEELIKHSEEREFVKLLEIIKLKEKKEEERKRKITSREKLSINRQFIQEPVARKVEIKKAPVPRKEILPQKQMIAPRSAMPVGQQNKQPTLLVPESKLPEHLEYLRPIPKAGIEIDLGKLNSMVRDPAVRIIEASIDEKVIVTGTMGTKSTDIILNKEEIDRVIAKFSELSKIPIEEGIYRVAVGNLNLSAVISEVIGSKFVIKKIMAPPAPLQPRYAPQSPPPRVVTGGYLR